MGEINYKYIALSIVSAILAFLALPGPVEIPLLIWIAIIPLIYVLAVTTGRRAAYYGLIFGVVFYGLNFHWMLNLAEIPVLAWGLSVLILGFFHFSLFGLAVVVFRKLFPKLYLANFVFLWVIFDFIIRENMFSLPILNLAESQYNNLSLIQIADIGGIYLVTALVILGNVAVYAILTRILKYKKIEIPANTRYIIIASFVLLLLTFIIYGNMNVLEIDSESGATKVLAVQPNFIHDSEQLQNPVTRYEVVSDMTINAYDSDIDLILWPEVTINSILYQDGGEKLIPLENSIDPGIRQLSKELETPIIFGTNVLLPGETPGTIGRFYNSSLLVEPEGITNWYGKKKLLWGAEYLPDIFGGAKDYFNDKGWGLKTIGFNSSVFETGDITVGNVICSENGHGDYASDQIKNGAQFLINPTDDSSFRDKNVVHQHEVVNIFRAIENRKFVVTAGNVGGTGVVEPSGELVANLDAAEPGTISYEVRDNLIVTPFIKYGNWVIKLLIVAVLLQLITIIKPKLESKQLL